MKADIHLHSDFSLDSVMDMEDAVKSASDAGFSTIAFTDHVDFDFPGYGDKFNVDFEKYFNKTSMIESKYLQMKIIRAVEAGITAETLSEVKKYLSPYAFDYVVLSDHIILGEDPYSDNAVYSKHSKNLLYKRYLSDIYDYMVEYEDFDTLGHYDYITRYATYDDPNMTYSEFGYELDRILIYLAENSKALEINTRTYDEKKYGKRFFDIEILKRFKQLNGQYICLGSDSHDTSSIGFRFEYFKELLRSAGFNELTYFIKRKPVKYAI